MKPIAEVKLDYSKISDVKIVDINQFDAPYYVDAFIESASYNGREMTDDELAVLNKDRDFVYKKLLNKSW